MLKGSIFVFLGACSFGILSTFAKMAYSHGFTPGEVMGVQALFGLLTLWALYLLQTVFKIGSKKVAVAAEASKTPAWKVIAAGLSTGSVSVFYYQCIQLIPASIAIVLLMQFVWLGVLLEAVIFKKRPSRIQLFAVVVVLAGTCLASGLLSSSIGNISMLGIIFGLLAAVAYSFFILLNGRVGTDLPPLKKSALMLTGASALIFTIFPPAFIFDSALFAGLVKWGIILALFGTVIPPLFYAIGVPKTGVALSSILSSAELPVAVCMSYFVLHEPVDALRWAGVVIILIAMIVPNLKHLKLS